MNNNEKTLIVIVEIDMLIIYLCGKYLNHKFDLMSDMMK